MKTLKLPYEEYKEMLDLIEEQKEALDKVREAKGTVIIDSRNIYVENPRRFSSFSVCIPEIIGEDEAKQRLKSEIRDIKDLSDGLEAKYNAVQKNRVEDKLKIKKLEQKMELSSRQNLLLEFVTKMHEGQVRKYSGEPYVTHCIQVAELVSDLGDLFFDILPKNKINVNELD